MILYHFTSTRHLPFIQDAGALYPSESNVGGIPGLHTPGGTNVGPRVVWLLDTPEVTFPHGLRTPQAEAMGIDKTAVRFTVDVPDRLVVRWREWVWTARMDPDWREVMVRTAGGEEATEHWFIVPGRIPASRWIAVDAREEVTP